ncbi:hypothetical protein ACQKWADRAFT_323130 [Trichoderma austrokoningii]
MDYPPDPPVKDHLKPDLPYIPGAVLKIQQCRPHAPFGVFFNDTTTLTEHMRPWRQSDTASGYCLQNPLLQGEPIANPETRTIIIDSQIRCGEGSGAQVVKCHYEDGETPLAAKIYDPLCYLWPDLDIAYWADLQFTTEAAAFMTLQDMDKDHSIGYPRVREAVNGSIPRMRSILDEGRVESIPAQLKFYGVNQHDFAPRNIMVDPDKGRVVLLDFSVAKIRNLYNSRWSHERLPAGPTHPLEQWAGTWAGMDVEGWVPEYLHAAQARYDWFLSQWRDSTMFKPFGWFWYNRYEPRLREDMKREKEKADAEKKRLVEEKQQPVKEGKRRSKRLKRKR